MGIFRKRNLEETKDLLKIINNSQDMIPITREKAMGISSVNACINLIADCVAGCRIGLYKNDSEKVIEIKDDYRLKLLNCECGNNLDGFNLKKNIVIDYLLFGNAYIYINRNAKGIDNLYYVKAEDISVVAHLERIIQDNYLFCKGSRYEPYEFVKVLNNSVDGVSGSGIINELKSELNLLISTQEFEWLTNQKGGYKRGVIKSDKVLSIDALRQLKQDVNEFYKGNNDNSVFILNSGLNFEELSYSLSDLQLVENKKVNTDKIYEYFRISKSLINNSNSSSGSIDYNKDHFIALSVRPITQVIENALNRDLLKESEKSNYFFAFDMKDIAKGSTIERFKAYNDAIRGRWMTPSEVRKIENLDPIDGLDRVLFNLSDVLYNPLDKTFFTPNTKDISDGKKGGDKVASEKD